MKELRPEIMVTLSGGDTCHVAGIIGAIACAATLFGGITAIIAGPTCGVITIGRAIAC